MYCLELQHSALTFLTETRLQRHAYKIATFFIGQCECEWGVGGSLGCSCTAAELA